MWLVGWRTQNVVAVGGPKEFQKLICFNVKNSIPLIELLISFWQNDCLDTPHELANFHILEFSLKQFESLGNK